MVMVHSDQIIELTSFSDQPTTIFGQKLKDQVEERLSFFESGEMPRKNIEVMQEAISELEMEKVQHKTSAAADG